MVNKKRKTVKSDIIKRKYPAHFIPEYHEETTVDIYEVIYKNKSPRSKKQRVPEGFNLGWLLEQIPEEAKNRFETLLSKEAKLKECPYVDCSLWLNNYCSTIGLYRTCETYLKANSKKSKNFHKNGFLVGVEIRAQNISL